MPTAKERYGMKELLKDGGYGDSEADWLEDWGMESVVPGICTECGYTTEYEPDATKGWCEICETGTVKSGPPWLSVRRRLTPKSSR